MQKAIDRIKERIAREEAVDTDLALLSNYLQSNDLNTHPLEWYESNSFETIIASIQKSLGSKLLQRARDLVFEYPENAWAGAIPIPEPIRRAQSAKRKPHGFIDTLLTTQLPYIFTHPDDLAKNVAEAQSFLRWILFDDVAGSLQALQRGESYTVNIADTKALTAYVTETRKHFMRQLWERN